MTPIFSAASVVGAVFATNAAVALATAQHDAQMDTALASRDLIGQAKGILMNREGVTADQAFEVLREASQRLNMKLRDVAERVTYTGELPPSDPSGASRAPQGDVRMGDDACREVGSQ